MTKKQAGRRGRLRKSKPTKFLGSYEQAISYLDEFVIRKNERPTGLFPPEQIGKRWYR